MPIIQFIETEIEVVREILTGIGTSSAETTELADKLSGLNDAQATRVRSDITAWSRIENGTVRVKGGIKGQDFSLERDRLLITNRMRTRLNYPVIASLDADAIGFVTLRGPGWSSPA